MHMSDTMDHFRTLALGFIAVGQTLFVLLYLTFPWWRSFLGRALFFKAAILCVVLDTYMLYRLTEFPHADVVFVFLYALLGVGVWSQFFAFLHIARTQKRSEWERGERK